MTLEALSEKIDKVKLKLAEVSVKERMLDEQVVQIKQALKTEKVKPKELDATILTLTNEYATLIKVAEDQLANLPEGLR